MPIFNYAMLRFPLLIVLLLASAPAQAAEPEYYIGPRNGADVYAQPSTSAKKIAHLDRLAPVKITKKERTWWHVESIGQTEKVSGWVASGAIRKRYQPETANRKSSSFFSGFSSFFGYGRSSAPEKTAVLGVRGLDEEESARKESNSGNTSAVKWMDGLKVSQQEVDEFIRQGDLNP